MPGAGRLLIAGGRLLDAAARAFVPTDILVEDGTIRALLRPGEGPAQEAAETFDAAGLLLHPGLVNAHTHGHAQLCKGMGDRWTLELLLTAAVWTYANRTQEDRYLSTLLAAAEMALKGCTACYDLNMELPGPTPEGIWSVAQAYADIGIRAVVAPAVADRSFFEAVPGLLDALPPDLRAEAAARRPSATAAAQLAALARALRDWPHDRSAVAPGLAPTIPMHCSAEFLQGCARLARDHDLPVQSHVAESKVQAVYAAATYGRPIVQELDAQGLVGPRFTVAHGVWLLEEEMALLGARGAGVAHNPGSNMRIGSGIADVRALLRHGVTIGIGTDGANCADHQNMYEAMRLASLTSKLCGPDTTAWLATEEVWRCASEGGPRLMGMEGRIGRILPGYAADIVFLDAMHPNWLPMNDAVNQLIHSEDGTAIRHVMVGGRMIVRDGRLLGLDTVRLAARAEASRARLAALNVSNRALFERLGEVVNTFCPGLARQPFPIDRWGPWPGRATLCCPPGGPLAADIPSTSKEHRHG